MLGRAKVGFAPYRPYPFFLEGWHRGLLSGSVAGAPTARPLLIRGKNIVVRAYFKWYGSTVRRSICCDWGQRKKGDEYAPNR
jgi:hypothetical protein